MAASAVSGQRGDGEAVGGKGEPCRAARCPPPLHLPQPPHVLLLPRGILHHPPSLPFPFHLPPLQTTSSRLPASGSLPLKPLTPTQPPPAPAVRPGPPPPPPPPPLAPWPSLPSPASSGWPPGELGVGGGAKQKRAASRGAARAAMPDTQPPQSRQHQWFVLMPSMLAMQPLRYHGCGGKHRSCNSVLPGGGLVLRLRRRWVHAPKFGHRCRETWARRVALVGVARAAWEPLTTPSFPVLVAGVYPASACTPGELNHAMLVVGGTAQLCCRRPAMGRERCICMPCCMPRPCLPALLSSLLATPSTGWL